jgi:ribonuclease HI
MSKPLALIDTSLEDRLQSPSWSLLSPGAPRLAMADHPVLTIHTDGASRGNPGVAACAYIIARDGHQPIEVAEVLGEMTNNQAEYTALVKALEHALELGSAHSVVVHSDSELMVKQMKGEYRVKNEELRDLYDDAQQLAGQFQGQVIFRHVRRAQNSRADALCNEALDGKRFGGPRQAGGTVEHPEGPTAETLRSHALACLWQAAAAWGTGVAEPTPEEVWEQLVGVLQKHGVRLP